MANKTVSTGIIFGRVKGGFTVDLQRCCCVLARQSGGYSPCAGHHPTYGHPTERSRSSKWTVARGNIVVSRRAVLEETRARTSAAKLMEEPASEGQVLDGVVKNITDYGAFVDLGGVDGLLHVTDISWKRINHPVRSTCTDGSSTLEGGK